MKDGGAQHYYLLESSNRSPLHLSRKAYDEARNSWLCSGCALPKPDVRGIDFLLDDLPEEYPLNFGSGTGVGIARRDFLFSLGEEEVVSHLWLGRVFGPDGKLLDDWATFIGRHRIIVRGTKGSCNNNFRIKSVIATISERTLVLQIAAQPCQVPRKYEANHAPL